MMKWLISIAALASAASVGAVPTDFSFTGNIADDDDVLFFNFTANGTSEVTLRSYSYAGGTNAAGQVIAAGGFDPILTLYDSTGTRIDFQDDAPSGVPADATTGSEFDVLFTQTLAAGAYRVALSQYDNFGPADLNTGSFDRAGEPDFTQEFCDTPGDQFCDVNGFGRTSFYAFDLLNVETVTGPGEPVPVPEPAMIGLLGLGVAVMAAARRRRA